MKIPSTNFYQSGFMIRYCIVKAEGKMIILLIVITSLICVLSSTTVAAFINCNSHSRQKQQTQQWTHDTNQSVDVRELQFNLMDLIQIDDDISKQNMLSLIHI